MSTSVIGRGLLVLTLLLVLPLGASGADETEERLSAVERAVGVLSKEQDRLRTAVAVPEDGVAKSYEGLAPYASKVYFKEKGLSIGGYGEWRGRIFVDDNPDDKQNELDQLRAVIYLGYKFNDWIVFNSEIEFEHAGTTGEDDVAVEFSTLDFLFDETVNARAGLLLLPMGFINEVHEPTFFLGASRPEPERRIIPSTWRENGAGLYGTLFERVHYKTYVVNGFDATGFDSSGLRGGRQKGGETLADDFAFVGRVDVDLLDGVLVGGSVYTGKSGQNQNVGGNNRDVPDTLTTIWEVHAQVRRAGFSLRGLYTQAHLDDTGDLNRALYRRGQETVARRMIGGYGEIAYDLMPLFRPDSEMSLEPFYRYERIDTQDDVKSGFKRDREEDRNLHVVGLQFKPHPQVVLKLDYRNISSKGSGQKADEVEFGFGYVF